MRPALLAVALLAASPVLAGPVATFTASPLPTTDEQRANVLASSHVTIGARTWPLEYHPLFHPGDKVGSGQAGLVTDDRGQPILRSPAHGDAPRARGPFFAASPDANTLVPMPGVPRRLALVTHFEHEPEGVDEADASREVVLNRLLPMLLDVTTLKQDPASGLLEAVDLAPVDASRARGIWTPCNGSLSPWGTHLGSEEYEPDARYFEKLPLETMNLWLRTPGRTAKQGGANPYDYGHATEVRVKGPGKDRGGVRAVATKHFAMGRLSFELSLVMPDERTVYHGDDARDGVQFLFVADHARDLSAGKLYAARWTMTDTAGFGVAKLEWIPMGHATDAGLEKLVRSGLSFPDLFDVGSKDAPGGFRPVQVYPGTAENEKSQVEWLRPRAGRAQAAAFLESRRMAGWLGATTELVKMEGLARSASRKRLYVAISKIGAGMVAGRNGERPRDDIRLDGDPQDLACGAVYESALGGGAKDTSGAPIDSDWVAADMRPLVTGAANRGAGADLDPCDPERVSGPDNLDVSEALDVLFIGEDTDDHFNNALWAVPLGGGPPVRLLTAPAGAEVAGLRAVDDASGFAYVLANVQHPGTGAEMNRYPEPLRRRFEGKIDERGTIGYLGPFRVKP